MNKHFPFQAVRSPQAPLLDKDCHIWLVDLHISKPQQNSYVSLLSAEEAQKAGRFHFEKDRRSFIAARASLRNILAAYLKMAPQDIVFDYLEYGKPFLPHENDIQFNLSHSGTYAIIALTRIFEVGIDIEEIRQQEDLLDVAKHYFADSEYQALIKLPKEKILRTFYRIWTRKESIIKLLGTGLQLPLDSFTVTLDKDEEFKLLSCNWDNKRHEDWSFHSLAIRDSYMTAWTTEGKIKDCKHWLWEHIPH